MSQPSGISEIAKQAMLMPQEKLETVKTSRKIINVGIPKETSYQENRIALTPLSVGLLIQNDIEVRIETGAGVAANFSDKEYSEQGAQIVHSAKEVYKSDVIIKVAPPTLEEMEFMHLGQTLISAIHLGTLSKEYIQILLTKKVNAISYEFLRDEGNTLIVVRSMSEIVGSTSIMIAAEYLSTVAKGKGLMLGGITGIPPTEIVIIGAGTVGEFAARTAIGLGAMVKVFDNSVYKLRRLQNNIGSRVFTSVIQPVVLAKALSKCDVAVGATRAESGRSPMVVSETMVAKMKAGSIIIDVSIDQGGCFETSKVTNHSKPTFLHDGIIHYCVPNIASRVSRTASYALTNIFTPILLDIAASGGLNDILWSNAGLRQGVYVYNGCVTNKILSEKFNLPFKDLNLLAAAKF